MESMKTWPKPLFLVALVVLANVGTYLLLCKPEFDLRNNDPTGYKQLTIARSSGGWLWRISPESRCFVHGGVATGGVLLATLIAYLIDRLIRRSGLWLRPKT
jgi:hypothetical protein